MSRHLNFNKRPLGGKRQEYGEIETARPFSRAVGNSMADRLETASKSGPVRTWAQMSEAERDAIRRATAK